jgi:hypothetical protein
MESTWITESQATENIRQSFIEGYLYSYGASSAKNIASGNRAAVALDVLNYTKSYVNSPAFIKAYEDARTAAAPSKPLPAKTKEQIQKEKIAELDKTIAEGEKSMKTLPKDLIEPFKEFSKCLTIKRKTMRILIAKCWHCWYIRKLYARERFNEI